MQVHWDYPVNTHLLIDAIVRQTMVLIAQLATSGGVRAPLIKVADQVFSDLTTELQNQGVTKKVIADMFGLALRTYHRRVQETRESRSAAGSTVWEAVLDYIREHEPVTAGAILTRFSHDDHEVVSGVLNDLAGSGLCMRSGRGDRAIYRIAPESDLAQTSSDDTIDWLVWLTVYRLGPISLTEAAKQARLNEFATEEALRRLGAEGKVQIEPTEDGDVFSSSRFETPLGTSQGWEAAVLDHFQAMSGALCAKLAQVGGTSGLTDTVGGSTWTLDVWDGHPLQEEARTTLARLRQQVEELRRRIDEYNEASSPNESRREKLIVYLGQNHVVE